ncbi:MAG: AAA family ATPase [Planctomycetes bacterium]|nr:AAA family ATPase [Planctomycetota bacterium]
MAIIVERLTEMVLHCAADQPTRNITWLVPGLIPFGAITIIDGDPGQGKSFLTLELAAAVSQGLTLSAKGRVKDPDRKGPLASMILNAEDDMNATLKPRLDGLGANGKYIHFGGEGFNLAGEPSSCFFPEHNAILARAIHVTKAKLVVIDPIMQFLSPDVRTASDQSVRQALNGLKLLARKYEAAIVLVRHLNKQAGPKVLYRGGGSIGIIGLARSGIYIGPDPEDRDTKIMAQVKNNLGPLQTPWTFRMEQRAAGRVIRWGGPTDVPLSRVLDAPAEPTPSERCLKFLNAKLGAGGMEPINALMAEAKKQGLSYGTLMRVKRELNVECTKVGKRTFWSIRKKSKGR